MRKSASLDVGTRVGCRERPWGFNCQVCGPVQRRVGAWGTGKARRGGCSGRVGPREGAGSAALTGRRITWRRGSRRGAPKGLSTAVWSEAVESRATRRRPEGARVARCIATRVTGGRRPRSADGPNCAGRLGRAMAAGAVSCAERGWPNCGLDFLGDAITRREEERSVGLGRWHGQHHPLASRMPLGLSQVSPATWCECG